MERKSMRPDPPRPQYEPIHKRPRRTPVLQRRAETIHTEVPLRQQFGKPGNKDWYFFSLELRTLLHAGVPMIQALKLLESSAERMRVRKAAALMSAGLAKGVGLSSAVASNRELPILPQALLIMGQQTGRLVPTLDLIIRHYLWMMEIHSLILRSIWYPALLVILGACIMVMRDVTLASLTGAMETEAALRVYSWRYFSPILYGAVSAVVATSLLKLRTLRRAVDAFLLTIPGIGGISKKYSVAVFFEVLAAAVESGMPITTGYDLAADSVPNRAIGDRLKRWSYFLQDGEPLTETLKRTGVLPPDALGMVASGEASAEVPFLLRNLAKYYHQQIRNHTRMLIVGYTPLTLAVVAVGYYVNVSALGALAFVLVFLFRLV